MEDPIRLAEDPATPFALRDLVAAAEGEAPTRAALARMTARLEAMDRGGGAGPGDAAGRGGAGRWLLCGGAVGVLAAALVLSRWSGGDGDLDVRPPTATATPSSSPAILAPVAPVAAPAPPAARTTDDARATPASRPARTARASTQSAPVARTARTEAPSLRALAASPAAPPPPAPAGPDEPALIELARGAVAAQAWTRALTATGEHARRFPAGALAEEREAVAIEALIGAGRRDAARARLAALIHRTPTTAYRDRLERLLEAR